MSISNVELAEQAVIRAARLALKDGTTLPKARVAIRKLDFAVLMLDAILIQARLKEFEGEPKRPRKARKERKG